MVSVLLRGVDYTFCIIVFPSTFLMVFMDRGDTNYISRYSMLMKTLKSYKHVIWFDETLIDHCVEQAFDPDYWHAQNKVLGSAEGRGTTWFVQTDILPAALRHYKRGGLFGKLIKDHYWFIQWHKTRSFEEFQLLQHLVEAGVNVPKPIAARAVKRTLCYQADILTQKIEGAQDLVTILQSRILEPEVYQSIGAQIRQLHDANVNHTDLNIHNILLDRDNKVWLIDFDKCYREKSEMEINHSGWKKSNLDRLLRSFYKEKRKVSIKWGEHRDWEMLLSGYNKNL